MTHDFTAAELAQFDQAYAYGNTMLDGLIDDHRGYLTDRPMQQCIAVAARLFHENADHESAASLLAIAIHRLATQEDTHV